MKIMAILVVFGVMSAGQIGTILSSQAQKGASPQTLWNLGVELYYGQGFPEKEMAGNLAQAYSQAAGQTPEQNAALKKAAAFWSKEFKNWDRIVAPAQTYPDQIRKFYRPFVRGFSSPALPLSSSPRP